MSQLSEQEIVRREKLKNIRALGIDPYPANLYPVDHTSQEVKDTFEEAGNGFGRTFDFRYFPIRIDFILVDQAFEVNNFKVLEEKLSDHYPIIAKINLHK